MVAADSDKGTETREYTFMWRVSLAARVGCMERKLSIMVGWVPFIFSVGITKNKLLNLLECCSLFFTSKIRITIYILEIVLIPPVIDLWYSAQNQALNEIPVSLKITCRLLQHRFLGSASSISDSVSPGWELKICISDKFPGELMMVVPTLRTIAWTSTFAGQFVSSTHIRFKYRTSTLVC